MVRNNPGVILESVIDDNDRQAVREQILDYVEDIIQRDYDRLRNQHQSRVILHQTYLNDLENLNQPSFNHIQWQRISRDDPSSLSNNRFNSSNRRSSTTSNNNSNTQRSTTTTTNRNTRRSSRHTSNTNPSSNTNQNSHFISSTDDLSIGFDDTTNYNPNSSSAIEFNDGINKFSNPNHKKVRFIDDNNRNKKKSKKKSKKTTNSQGPPTKKRRLTHKKHSKGEEDDESFIDLPPPFDEQPLNHSLNTIQQLLLDSDKSTRSKRGKKRDRHGNLIDKSKNKKSKSSQIDNNIDINGISLDPMDDFDDNNNNNPSVHSSNESSEEGDPELLNPHHGHQNNSQVIYILLISFNLTSLLF